MATLNDDPQAVAAMELIRRRAMPDVATISATPRFDLSQFLTSLD